MYISVYVYVYVYMLLPYMLYHFYCTELKFFCKPLRYCNSHGFSSCYLLYFWIPTQLSGFSKGLLFLHCSYSAPNDEFHSLLPQTLGSMQAMAKQISLTKSKAGWKKEAVLVDLGRKVTRLLIVILLPSVPAFLLWASRSAR